MKGPNSDPITLRLPKGWKEVLKGIAERNRRTVTAEILHQLEQNFNETAGAEFADRTPAARHTSAAHKGVASITNGIGDAIDDIYG